MHAIFTTNVDAATQVKNPLEMPRGPITRARAKKFKEALLNLIKTNILEGFEEGEMKEETGNTTMHGYRRP